MKSDKNPAPVYLFAAEVAAQIGCALVVVVGGAVLLGLLLDQVFHTKTLFIFVLLLGSIPLSLWAIYRYTQYQSKRLQGLAQQKENTISDD
ncbi:MAG TPA: AtpZ/AtpI family protein [Phototrophicaceae bacterium]|nr:AtpZ/AtpI family protein [Phototrophicaceae bacterium]